MVNSENQPCLHLYSPLAVAVDRLPNFLAAPTPNGKPGPHHQCSIHINCESVEVLETAYKEALNGRPSARFEQSPPRSRPQLSSSVANFLSPVISPQLNSHIIHSTSRHFS